MYATTRQFLDYFNLKSLDQLPALADIRDLETLNAELGFEPLEPQTEGEAETAAEESNDANAEGPEDESSSVSHGR
jgi:segregation and condensation protein B